MVTIPFHTFKNHSNVSMFCASVIQSSSDSDEFFPHLAKQLLHDIIFFAISDNQTNMESFKNIISLEIKDLSELLSKYEAFSGSCEFLENINAAENTMQIIRKFILQENSVNT